MVRQFLTSLFLIILLLGCEKNELDPDKDPNYPTIINRISPSELTIAKTAYIQKNKYIHSSLNQFGFCDFEESDLLRTVESPPISDLLTEPEAIEIVNDFVSENQTFTGINEPSDLSIEYIRTSSGYPDGTTFWYLESASQKIDTLEVLNSRIGFRIKNRELYYCAGNWFPEIYIPSNFSIDQDKAKASLLNKVVSHYTIAGVKYNVKITSSSLTESTIKLVICPVKTEDTIELRVTWQINIPAPVHYMIFIDVMTYEIISEASTIVS